MGIFRVKKDSNYSVIHNTPIQDSTLSWRAKGLLIYILSLPDDWTFYIEELSKHSKDSEDTTRKAVSELKKAGYLRRFPVQDPSTGKITHWETAVYETPNLETTPAENQSVEEPPSGKTTMWKTTPVENQSVDFPTLQNTNLLLSTEELSTNSTNDDDIEPHQLIDVAYKNCYAALQTNGIPLSVKAQQELGEFTDTLGEAVVQEAINRAIDENAPRWNYIRGILIPWQNAGVKSIADIAALDAQFKNRKGGGTNATHRSGYGSYSPASRSYAEEYANRRRNMPSFIKRV